jgi:pyruvate dehydrogenase E1 component alpha subunit
MATKTASAPKKKATPAKPASKKTTAPATPGKEQWLKWYEDMLVMRRIEEKAGQLYIEQKFGGFCHLYIGQEAVVAGTMSACLPGDKHITAYRDHAHPIALGVHPKYMMAELYGRTTGMSKGKGGSMHMFHKEVNLMGGHGIVGAQIPMGAGIAFAEKYNGTSNICVASMGDGAVRQGALHETFNMAMLWKLPVIFLIENNNYAMGTSIERTTNMTDLSTLGLSYGMPSKVIDGMNVLNMHNGMLEAAAFVRAGNGPILLDVRTYRYKGHSMSDPQKYRSKEEVDEYKAVDPVEQALSEIKKMKYAIAKEIEAIQKRVEDVVAESVKFAEESPLPAAEELYEDVYAEPNYPFIREYA